MNREIIEKVTKSCNEIFAAQKNYELPDEFNYGHLPLCVIDSVFSIGVNYKGVKNVVNRFCDHYKIDKSLNTEELTTAHFLELMEQQTVQELAENIYKNRQRTSTVSGILKSEAVVLFLKVLQKYKVERLSDIDKIIINDQFEAEIKKIAGQKSGISLKYFFMLAGSDDLIKPDRMILRFLENILEEKVSLKNCQVILSGVTEQLKNNGFNITAKKLDNLIWNYQRDIKTESLII